MSICISSCRLSPGTIGGIPVRGVPDVVARRDLELRGPGELLGTRQTGLAQMRVADLARDADLLPRVQTAAETLLNEWPLHVTPPIRRWVGHAEQYGRVG